MRVGRTLNRKENCNTYASDDGQLITPVLLISCSIKRSILILTLVCPEMYDLTTYYKGLESPAYKKWSVKVRIDLERQIRTLQIQRRNLLPGK
jgi:hypothetical protein